MNWSPVDRLNLLSSWTREEGPPTINQLGDPVLDTPGTRIFDFTTGQTVLADVITGGNPDLLADRRNVTKLERQLAAVREDRSAPARRICAPDDRKSDLEPERHRGDRSGVSRVASSAISSGQLISADLRPVNFESSRARHASHRVRLFEAAQIAPPVAIGDRSDARPISRVVPERRRLRADGAQANTPPLRLPRAASPQRPIRPAAPDRGARGGAASAAAAARRRVLRRRQPRPADLLADRHHHLRRQGEDRARACPRSTISTATLRGKAAARRSHHVEAQAGYFNNGLGARLNANWRSGTRVEHADRRQSALLAARDLRPRLFANPGDIPELAVKHPWLRGTQVQLSVNNIFNSRPKVHDCVRQACRSVISPTCSTRLGGRS